jgi:hypothetical protein
MATEFNFNGQLIKLPGAYAEIKSGINNAPLAFSYGNVLVIDTDSSNEFGGGSGINGESAEGQDSIYTFDNVRDVRQFLGGGELWDNVGPLFRPFGSGSQGVSNLIYIRALTTVAATLELTLEKGALTFAAKHEGLVGNGVEVDDELIKGFAVTVEAGTLSTDKFRLRFWRGTFTGNAQDGRSYNGLSQEQSRPRLLATSPEVATIQEIIDWAEANFDFNNHFLLTGNTISNTGEIVSGDLTSLAGNNLFSGGTQTSAPADMDAVLDAITKLDYTHIYSLESGIDALGVNNFKILSHLESEARYEKFLVVAGGEDKDTFQSQSIASATAFNSQKVILCHAGCYDRGISGTAGLRKKNARYHAAYIIGRVAGLPPQTPPTFKGLGYLGELHKMTDSERELALDAGVITTYLDDEIGSSVITQGVNTLQKNDNLVNEDGTSYSWQLMRIAAQLNKEIVINAKVQLLGNQNEGPNRATLSPEVVQEWVRGFLKNKTARATEDDLILSSQDVTVTIDQDAYCINYAFVPNFEVNKLFFTGLILDPNI